MPVFPCFRLRKRPLPRFRYGTLLALGCALALPAAWAKGPEKAKVISLEELGMQAAGTRPAAAGATRATVAFAGEHHLLVTFPVRRLMKRVADAQPGDDDRLIDALLIDLPTGKVAARTTWRLHDNGQYLWDLGHGRFMLRERNKLVTIAPVANVGTAEPFQEKRLLSFEDRIVGLLVSAEGDLLTVETSAKELPATQAANGDNAAAVHVASDVEINFYRLTHEAENMIVTHAGAVRSQNAVAIPMTSDGYLDITAESKTTWDFDYISHGGKKMELAPFDTTCYPRTAFISRSEFIAIGCRGSVDRQEMGGFNMKAEEMWQQNFYDNFLYTTFSFAPEAGRFAIGRGITNVQMSFLGEDMEPTADQLTGEDVQVLQASTGHPLFHMVVTPAQRAGQNYALAPDGMSIAVVRDLSLEIYKLPALSSHDRQEVKAAREFALEHSLGPIKLPTRVHPTAVAVQDAAVPGAPAASLAAAVPAPTAKPAAGAPQKPIENLVYVGDVPAAEGRPKPSLMNPGESVPK